MKTEMLIIVLVMGLIAGFCFIPEAWAGDTRVQIKVACRYEPKMQLKVTEQKPKAVIKPSEEQIFLEQVKSSQLVHEQEFPGKDKPRYKEFERVRLYTTYAY